MADLVEAAIGVPTIENALGVLRMVLKDAVDDGRLIRNPCEGINAPRRRHRPRAYLDHLQVEELATAIGEDHGLVVGLLAYTGLRWGELAALSVASVDLLRRRLQITRAVAEADGQLNWKSPKDHERRSVPFPVFLAAELGEQMAGKGQRICSSLLQTVGLCACLPGDLVSSTSPETHWPISRWSHRMI